MNLSADVALSSSGSSAAPPVPDTDLPSSPKIAPLPFATAPSTPMPCAQGSQALQLGLLRVTGKRPPSEAWKAAAQELYTQAMVSDEVLHNSTGLLFAGSKFVFLPCGQHAKKLTSAFDPPLPLTQSCPVRGAHDKTEIFAPRSASNIAFGGVGGCLKLSIVSCGLHFDDPVVCVEPALTAACPVCSRSPAMVEHG